MLRVTDVLSAAGRTRPGRGRAVTVVPRLTPVTIPPVVAFDHFAVDHVSYHQRALALVYDADGTHYAYGAGFHVLLDGKVAASAPSLQKLQVDVC